MVALEMEGINSWRVPRALQASPIGILAAIVISDLPAPKSQDTFREHPEIDAVICHALPVGGGQ